MSLLRFIETSCRALWAVKDLPSVCVKHSTDVQLMCVHAFAVHTPSIKQDSEHVSSLEKKYLFFFHDGSNLKISSKIITKAFFSRKNKSTFKALDAYFWQSKNFNVFLKLCDVDHNLWSTKVFFLAWWIHTGSIDTDNKKNKTYNTLYILLNNIPIVKSTYTVLTYSKENNTDVNGWTKLNSMSKI